MILRDISGGLGVGKAELDGQRFEVKVARLAPMTEFTVEVRGSFAQGSAVLGRFLSGAKGGAKFSIQVTDIDLSLVKEVEVRRVGTAPELALHGRPAAEAARLGICDTSVSLTHDGDHALATVVMIAGDVPTEAAPPEGESL